MEQLIFLVLLTAIIILIIVTGLLEDENVKLYEKKSYFETRYREQMQRANDAEKRASKHFKKLCDIENVTKQNNYDSIENLSNKIKTILANGNLTNIAR